MAFNKGKSARFISHLDLIHVLQRAFKRAGVDLRYSSGFNPHPYLSIALPLPVGFSSTCELLDFQTEREIEINPEQMNSVLPYGISATAIYAPDRPFRDIHSIDCDVLIECPSDPASKLSALTEMLAGKPIMVEKRSKSGTSIVDISPGILSHNASETGGNIALSLRLLAQNPGLSPEYVVKAFKNTEAGSSIGNVEFFRKFAYDAESCIFI